MAGRPLDVILEELDAKLATNLTFIQKDAAGNTYGARQTKTATILSGASVSDLIDLSGGSGLTLIGIYMPAAWTAAAIGFDVTKDDGVTWVNAYTTNGAPVQVASPTAGKYIALDPADFAGFSKLRLTSVTAGAVTGVNQGADRAFTLVARSV